MKSEIKQAVVAPKPITFPWLGRHKDFGYIILFSTPCVGTVVHQGRAAWPVGTVNAYWKIGAFERFDGSIILSNDDL